MAGSIMLDWVLNAHMTSFVLLHHIACVQCYMNSLKFLWDHGHSLSTYSDNLCVEAGIPVLVPWHHLAHSLIITAELQQQSAHQLKKATHLDLMSLILDCILVWLPLVTQMFMALMHRPHVAASLHELVTYPVLYSRPLIHDSISAGDLTKVSSASVH